MAGANECGRGYRISGREPEADRFDGLAIGNQTIGYRGYFTDLLHDLSGEKPMISAAGSKSPRWEHFF